MSEEQVHATSLTWDEVAAAQPIRLNLGGCGDCHPRKGYEGFVSVDTRAPHMGRWIHHDITQPFPLRDGSVERIHTEEVLQYLHLDAIEKILTECYRLLQPGGHLRLCTCDYNHPRIHKYLQRGSIPGQVTQLRYESMKEILERSPFKNFTFRHYWKDGLFTQHPIDYSLGHIRRTPEHDRRNREVGLRGILQNFLFRLKKGFILKQEDQVFLRGKPLFVTSLVVDCVK